MLQSSDFAGSQRWRQWGLDPTIATRCVLADARTLRMVVSDPATQWRLVAGAHPLLRAQAHAVASRHPRIAHASITLRGRDALAISWMLTPRPGTTEVDLAAQPCSRAILVRLVLVLGGRRALRRHLEATLELLATLARCAAEDVDEIERDGGLAFDDAPRAEIERRRSTPSRRLR